MNRTEELAKLAKLEKEVAELRALLEKPEQVGSLLKKPPFGSVYYQIDAAPQGGVTIFKNSGIAEGVEYGGNTFQSESIAQAYAEAIDTMLLLRHQPGTNGKDFLWTIAPKYEDCETVVPERGWVERVILMFSVPMFDTEESAQAAIDTIGANRILRMFKTLHGIYE